MPAPPQPGLSLEDCLFGSCVLGLADYVHAVRHEPRTQSLIRFATWLGVFACGLGITLMSTGRSATGLGVFVFGVLCFAAHNAPEQIAQRWFQRTPRQARHVKYTLSSHGLIVASDAARQLYPWTSLQGFSQAPEVFLVWVSARLFLVVPRRAFQADELPRVVERFAQLVGAPPALPRFWSWLGVAVLVAAGALLLWNRLAPR